MIPEIGSSSIILVLVHNWSPYHNSVVGFKSNTTQEMEGEPAFLKNSFSVYLVIVD